MVPVYGDCKVALYMETFDVPYMENYSQPLECGIILTTVT